MLFFKNVRVEIYYFFKCIIFIEYLMKPEMYIQNACLLQWYELVKNLCL